MEAVLIAAALMNAPADGHALNHFPPCEEVAAARRFNRAYLTHLNGMRAMWPHRHEEYAEAVGETARRYAIYDCLDDAQLARTLYYQRIHLERLRMLLGDEDFFAGRMPDPAPFHLFVEVGR